MLIRHLDFFVTLAEEQHFGRAAELCGVSQPALSLAIRKLEADLGTTLIVRGKRFAGLTVEGEKVLNWGRQIVADYRGLQDDLSGRRRGGLGGVLRLGMTPSAVSLAPLISNRFETRNPLTAIRLAAMPGLAVVDGVADFSLDAGVTWLPPELPPEIEARALLTAQPAFACRSDHPLATETSLTWDEALTQPLCLPDDLMVEMPPLRAIRPAIRCTNHEGVLAHLRTGLWCAVVTDSFACLLAKDDEIVLRDLTGDTTRPVLALLMRKRNPQSPLARALQDSIDSLLADGGLAAACSPRCGMSSSRVENPKGSS